MTKRNAYIILSLTVIILAACNIKEKGNKRNNSIITDTEIIPLSTKNSATKPSEDTLAVSPTETESLNEIRFGHWTEKDWYDNNYFKAIRTYLNTLDNAKISNDIEQYKSILKSNFIIYNVEPFIMGGLFVSITFLDAPTVIFDIVVYSDVDEETRKISNYNIKSMIVSKNKSGFTKDAILKVLEDHPQNKLW